MLIATPRSQELAAESLSEASDPALLLRYIDQNLRDIRRKASVASPHRLDSFVPYLDLLGEMAVLHFWDFCNKQGWFAWRRQHLDGRYPPKFRNPGLTDTDLYASLDHFASDPKFRMWVDRWVEEFAERGDPPRWVIDIVAKWLAERRSFEAFQVVRCRSCSSRARARTLTFWTWPISRRLGRLCLF